MTDNKVAPTHRLVWKNKTAKAKVGVGTGWPSQYGINISLDRERTNKQTGEVYPGVRSMVVTLDDGSVHDAQDYFMGFDEIKPRQH